MLLRRHPEDEFAGICPYHGDCLEGMSAGPAIEARWGVKGQRAGPRPQGLGDRSLLYRSGGDPSF